MTFAIAVVMFQIFLPTILCVFRYPRELIKIFVLNFVLGYLWVMWPPVFLSGQYVAFSFVAALGWFMLFDLDNVLKPEKKE